MIPGTLRKQIFALSLACILLTYTGSCLAQFSVSERTYKKLTKVERLMAKKAYQDALTILEGLKSSAKNKKYELSLVYQALAYLYYDTNDYSKATDYFEKSLNLNNAPVPVLQNIRLNLVQLYAISNDYQKATQIYAQWLEKEPSPSGDRLALGGSLYAHIRKYELAIKYLTKAISSTKSPRESWYRTLLSVYYQQQNYQAATDLLQKLVALHPENKEYWHQLFTGFYFLNDYKKALSALELAYKNGLVDSEEQIVNLAKLYLYLGNPIKAVNLIDTEFNKKRLNKTEPNLQLLATAYLQSQEMAKSAEVYLQLASTTQKGDLQLKAARLFMEARQWDKVVNTLEKAEIEPGDEQAYIMKGMALVELGHIEKAVNEFNRAKESADTRISATQWLEFLSTYELNTGGQTP